MKTITKNILKKVIYIFLILLLFGQLTSSCLQFRMSKSEVDKYFKEEVLKPKILRIQSKKRTINYALIESGQKPLVVFVHGAPGSLKAFIDFLKNKKLQKYINMIAIDRPGYGYSDFGREETSLVKQAYYLAEVVKKHKPANHKVILIGHSLGVPVIARMTMDYPELVDGLIFVGGSIDPAQEKKEWYRPLGSNIIGKIILPKSLWVTNEEIFFLKDELEKMLPLWKKIQVPVTIIQGEDDNLVPKKNVLFAQKMIKPEYLDVWLEKGMNHFIPWNRPDLINEALFYHTIRDDWRRSTHEKI